jgi:hypothetical protein
MSMMCRFLYGAILLAAAMTLACAHGSLPAAAADGTILPESATHELLSQCSRPVPEIEGTWHPAEGDVRLLESDLPRLLHMKAAGCCIRGDRVRSLAGFTRQYAGVYVSGRKYIYVNAFASTMLILPPGMPPIEWKTRPFIACDGGSGFWGVLYDPLTRRFSELAFNGIG